MGSACFLTRFCYNRQVEARTRKEMDEKREELRQLVGGSYRDLIDSADSIVEMAKTSQQVGSVARSRPHDVSHHLTCTRSPQSFLLACEPTLRRETPSHLSAGMQQHRDRSAVCDAAAQQ
jgi:hypothetical protein